jgi:hypothetical protein
MTRPRKHDPIPDPAEPTPARRTECGAPPYDPAYAARIRAGHRGAVARVWAAIKRRNAKPEG